MKSLFLPEILRGTVATLALTVLCGGLYPALVWGLGQAVFPTQANGSVMRDASGKIVGSSRLGRNFNGPQYFHPRPSAAGPDGYDVKASSGSNLGPTSQKLADALRERIAAYRTENSLAADASVPSDAVTSSASAQRIHTSRRPMRPCRRDAWPPPAAFPWRPWKDSSVSTRWGRTSRLRRTAGERRDLESGP